MNQEQTTNSHNPFSLLQMLYRRDSLNSPMVEKGEGGDEGKKKHRLPLKLTFWFDIRN